MALMLMTRHLRRYCFLILLLTFICCMGPSSTTYATSTYDTNSYGTCAYGQCATEPNTETVTPSGLQVAINLANGQIIPKNGYTIVVTPLNGQGSSFQNVSFTVNGMLVQTISPDTTGTASWLWVPDTTGATTITVDVNAGLNNTISNTFHVNVSTTSVTAATTAKTSSAATSEPGNVSRAFQQVYSSAKYVIRSLPKPIVYSLPYALFVLFGVNVLLLILQTQREVAAYHNLQVLLARQRSAAASKRTLVELLAHYFRTPLTILLGGIDMLGDHTSATATTLRQIGEQLRKTIEGLLADIRLTSEPATETTKKQGSSAIWRQPGLLIPLALIAFIVIPFNYIARHAGTLTISQTNLVIQGIVYAFLVITTYFVFRWRQLHRRNTIEFDKAIAQEQATEEARDQVITQATSNLEANIDMLTQLTSHLTPSQASTFIASGVTRFRALAIKLAAASRLRIAHANDIPVQTDLVQLIHDALVPLQETITTRRMEVVQHSTTAKLSTRSTSLLTYVIRTVVDNALAYSKDGSSIHIEVKDVADDTCIIVSDNGSGIPGEKLRLLFQPFSKAEGAEVFSHEGMGFSLYLDKLIMAYLGGEISLASKPHRGTTVTISLPKTVT